MRHLQIAETDSQVIANDYLTVYSMENNEKVYIKKPQPLPEFVDLGLPSGNLWARHNLGAVNEWDYGKYFQFGALEGFYGDDEEVKNHLGWATTRFTNGSTSFNNTYYDNNKNTWFDNYVLRPEFDAAFVLTEGEGRIPTDEEYAELIQNTNGQIWNNYENSGINGVKFINKTDDKKFIFVPFSGKWTISVSSGEKYCANENTGTSFQERNLPLNTSGTLINRMYCGMLYMSNSGSWSTNTQDIMSRSCAIRPVKHVQ